MKKKGLILLLILVMVQSLPAVNKNSSWTKETLLYHLEYSNILVLDGLNCSKGQNLHSYFLESKSDPSNDLLTAITSPNDEYGIAFISKDLVCFTRSEERKKLMLVNRVNGVWQKPYVAPFSGLWSDEYPSFDPKTNRLYFSSKRPLSGKKSAQSKNDIWFVEYQNGEFTTPSHLGDAFSTKGIDSGGCGLGDIVYFHSDRSGFGINDVDIYEGNLTNSTLNKLSINSERVDGEAFVFGKKKAILFMSAGHGAVGKSDIFIAQFEDNKWTKPVPVDNTGLVNTSAWEYSPCLSPDGSLLYFTRIVNGQADILSVRIKDLSSKKIFEQALGQKMGSIQNDINEKIHELISPLVQTNNFSGVVLVSKNKQRLFLENYGFSDVANNIIPSSQTKFVLASVSMIFTSAAIMKLKEEGKLKLDDKVSKFLPDYKHGDQLTIHHLLSQRSGIPAIGSRNNVDYGVMTLSKQETHDLYNYFKDYDLLFQPGSRYSHERSDYILLALIIEKITKQNYGEYLNEHIFLPLGMENTGHYEGHDKPVSNLAKGYAPDGLFNINEAPVLDWSSKTGHASIYSTALDLQKLGQAIIKGEFLTTASWEKVFSNYGDFVGYGWFVKDHGSHRRVQMNGRSPGYSSYFAVYPNDDLIVIMLSNNYVSLPLDMGKSIASIVFDEAYQPLKLSSKKISNRKAKKYEGKFQFDNQFYRPNFIMTIRYEDGYLFNDWGGLIPIDPTSNNFTEFMIRPYWLNLKIQVDSSGTIRSILIDNQHIGRKINS